MHRRDLTLLCLLALTASIALTASPAQAEDDLEHEGYALDALPRRVDTSGPMRCPEVALIPYAGTALIWKKELKVHPDFAKRLAQFEEVARSIATRIYGRAPARIAHLGSYNCRRIRRYPDLLSEHGIGNAIDISAFEFAALTKAERKTSTLPKALQRSFSASILSHWDSPDDARATGYHRRFLRELAAELERRPDIFRVLLGPAYPGHKDHFHFDCAPYRLVVL